MIVKRTGLTPELEKLFTQSLEKSNFTILDFTGWLDEGSAAIWNIGGVGYVATVANSDNEIEVLLAGGEHARKCAAPWEKAMREVPEFRGRTLRLEGRRAWQRIFPHWDCEQGSGGDVTLTTRV